MTEPPIEDNPSEDVLSELLGAFSVDSAADAAEDTTSANSEKYDFDDPSIDRLLGISPDAPTVVNTVVDPAVNPAVNSAVKDKVTREIKSTATSTVKPETIDTRPAKSGRRKLGKGLFKKRKPEQAATDTATPDNDVPSKKKDWGERPTIIIGGDDLPDAVSLDAEHEAKFLDRRIEEGNKERSTIVIADFDDVASVDASMVRSTMSGGGDQRIRARRISVRRAEGRRRLRWVVIGLAAIVIPVATLTVLASPLFDVSDVSVQGATYTDPTLIAAIINDIKGDPVLLVDTMELEKRLRADPWVESVKVETDFPHRVVIDIRERKPVAAFQGGDGAFRIIDYEGRVLDVIAGIPVDYMLITGDHPDTARGQFAGAPYSAAAGLVIGLPSEVRVLTESVGLNAATGALALQFTGGTLVQLGDASNMDEKLARLLSLVRGGLEGICELDVSTREVGSVPC